MNVFRPEFRHGLLIGKFYPPHLGHHEAIRTAAARCERVTVVVMASLVETITLADRVAWLAAEHAAEPAVHVSGIRCDAPVDVHDESIWRAQVAAVRAALEQAGRLEQPGPVDAVFSADDYGPELARRFAAAFVPLRRADERSASAVRADPAGRWADLAPATRAGMATRVVVVGAESSGTTTLSRALAEHYRARGGVWAATGWVGEYGREHTELKWAAERRQAVSAGLPEPELDELVWSQDDFDRVAGEQTAAEDAAARTGSPLLVCDTDAFATALWERRYLGPAARTGSDVEQPGWPAWTRSPLLPRRDLYLVTDHDGVPWLDDGLREGDLAVRAAMTGWFTSALTAAGHSWVLLTGSLDQRATLAVRTVDAVLTARMRFGTPFQGNGFTSS